jgi:glucoamylase
LARRYGVSGYYVRTEPARALSNDAAMHQSLPIKNCLQDPGIKAEDQVGTDFLQLVRFGLRRADDPLITASIKVADALLCVETPNGPAWHRYNGDGYGEHKDGASFDGTGVGRAWPLLSGERGHYELAAGRSPLPYLQAMAAMSGPGGMIPEQVWDTTAMPQRHLYPGKPTGSAMPLVWAHAEFIKLVHSWAIQRPFDRPEAVWQRYGGQRPKLDFALWSPGAPVSAIMEGQILRICLPRSATVEWRTAENEAQRSATSPGGLGLYLAEIDTVRLAAGQAIQFNIGYKGESEIKKGYCITIKLRDISQG